MMPAASSQPIQRRGLSSPAPYASSEKFGYNPGGESGGDDDSVRRGGSGGAPSQPPQVVALPGPGPTARVQGLAQGSSSSSSSSANPCLAQQPQQPLGAAAPATPRPAEQATAVNPATLGLPVHLALQISSDLVHSMWAKYTLDYLRHLHMHTETRLVFSLGSKQCDLVSTPMDLFMKPIASFVDPQVTTAGTDLEEVRAGYSAGRAAFNVQEEGGFGIGEAQPRAAAAADVPSYMTFFVVLNAYPHRHKLPPHVASRVPKHGLAVLRLHALELMRRSRSR
jgi:hypothetical protein